jgi:hypothetical protein
MPTPRHIKGASGNSRMAGVEGRRMGDSTGADSRWRTAELRGTLREVSAGRLAGFLPGRRVSWEKCRRSVVECRGDTLSVVSVVEERVVAETDLLGPLRYTPPRIPQASRGCLRAFPRLLYLLCWFKHLNLCTISVRCHIPADLPRSARVPPLRPEIGDYHAYDAKAFDIGRKNYLWQGGIDTIIRF